jgi:hypothetical protein
MKFFTRQFIGVVAVSAALGTGCGAVAGQDPGPALAVSRDEQAIYEAVLSSWLGSEHAPQMVNENLGPPPSAADPENTECVRGLRFVDNQPNQSNEKTLAGVTFSRNGIELVDGETWTPTDPEQSIQHGGPVGPALNKAISRSLISFSQVRFSADGKDAIVRFSMACGRLCGTGTTLQVHKRRGQWRIARRCGGYIS